MTRKRPERKRDLAGLLGESPADLTRSDLPTQTLPVTALRPGSQQPRRSFGEQALEELARSVREQGVLQPLLVRPVDGGFEIVAGERRWRAAQLAGLSDLPVIVRELSDQQARSAALIENLQREDLNVIDEVDGKLDLVALALGLDREAARTRLLQLLREEPGDDAATLDALFGPLGETWQSYAKNKLRVLGWPTAVVAALRAGLPLTLASVIVGTPEAHHARLIALAQGGASRVELRAEALRLAEVPEPSSPAEQAVRRLTSRRFMARLSPEDRKVVDRWLAKMPEVLKQD